MSNRQFCDRCGGEITGKRSGHVDGVPDADAAGNGITKHSVDLCRACYRAFVQVIQPIEHKSKGK